VTTGVAERLSLALADRYRIERELGQGGMAIVYLAEDQKHGRKVAIKVLHPELSAIIGGERFLTSQRRPATRCSCAPIRTTASERCGRYPMQAASSRSGPAAVA
jgi:serine/threonine protein kinase